MSLATHVDTTALDHKVQRLCENDISSFSYGFPRNIPPLTINATARSIGQALIMSTPTDTSGRTRCRLESLSLRTNNSTLPDQESIADILRFLASSSLKEFTLAGQTVPHVDLYLQALQENKCSQLQKLSLYCRDFPMTDVCQLLLRRQEQSNHTILPSLQSLTLCGNRIQLYSRRYILSSQEIQLFLEALAGTSSLKHLELSLLDFSNHSSNNPDVNTPTKHHRLKNESLQHLVLKENNMDHAMAMQLMGMFSNLRHLQVLESTVLRDANGGGDTNNEWLNSWSPMQEIQCCQPLQLQPMTQTMNMDPWGLILANSDKWTDLTLFHREGQIFENDRMTQLGAAIEGRNGATIESLTVTSPLSNDNLQHILRPLLTSQKPSSQLAVDHLSLKFRNLQALPTALAELLVHPKCAVQKLTLDFVGGTNLTNDVLHPLWMALRQNTSLKRLVVKGHGPNVQSRAAFQSLGEGLSLLQLQELTLDEGLRESLMALKCLIALPLMERNDRIIRLAKLTLSHVVIGDATAKYCAQVIKYPGCFLRELSFVECRFQRKGRELLIDSLAEMSTGTLLESFQLGVDGGFTRADGLKLAKVLPDITQLKRLTLRGFRHYFDRSSSDPGTKLYQAFLVALSKNTSLEFFDIDLEAEGFSFQSKVLFYALRNSSNHLISQTSSPGAHGSVPAGLWPRVIEAFQTKRLDCPSAVFHLLSKNANTLIPGN